MVSCGSRHGSCEVKSPPVVVYINTYILNLFCPLWHRHCVFRRHLQPIPVALPHRKFSREVSCATQRGGLLEVMWGTLVVAHITSPGLRAVYSPHQQAEEEGCLCHAVFHRSQRHCTREGRRHRERGKREVACRWRRVRGHLQGSGCRGACGRVRSRGPLPDGARRLHAGVWARCPLGRPCSGPALG